MTKDLWFVSKYKIWSFYSINNRLRDSKLAIVNYNYITLFLHLTALLFTVIAYISPHYQIFAWIRSFKTPNAWLHFLSNIAFLCFNSEKNYRPLQLQESLWAIIRKTCKLQSWNFPRLSPRPRTDCIPAYRAISLSIFVPLHSKAKARSNSQATSRETSAKFHGEIKAQFHPLIIVERYRQPFVSRR